MSVIERQALVRKGKLFLVFWDVQQKAFPTYLACAAGCETLALRHLRCPLIPLDVWGTAQPRAHAAAAPAVAPRRRPRRRGPAERDHLVEAVPRLSEGLARRRGARAAHAQRGRKRHDGNGNLPQCAPRWTTVRANSPGALARVCVHNSVRARWMHGLLGVQVARRSVQSSGSPLFCSRAWGSSGSRWRRTSPRSLRRCRST